MELEFTSSQRLWLPETLSVSATILSRSRISLGKTFSKPLTLHNLSLLSAVPTSPGAPEILVSGKDFATIEWLKPESDGGSPLTHYLVERRERKSARWVKVNRDRTHLDTTLKVSGLTEGNIYQFRVTAINKAGESEPSEVSLYVVCRVPTCKSD